MPTQCQKMLQVANRENKRRGGLAKNYFRKDCPDPYTALNYWRRRFRTQDCYLGQYFVPYQVTNKPGKPGWFGTTRPYRTNGFSMGNACPVLYRNARNVCKKAYNGTTCGQA